MKRLLDAKVGKTLQELYTSTGLAKVQVSQNAETVCEKYKDIIDTYQYLHLEMMNNSLEIK